MGEFCMLFSMNIRYTSTRNARVSTDVADAIARGMPDDGGLFVPARLPALRPEALREPNLSYAELAWLVMSPYFDWSEEELRPLIERAYSDLAGGDGANFDVPEIAPLRAAGGVGGAEAMGAGEGAAPSLSHLSDASEAPLFLLELFHGRTCAFKDLALSLLGDLLRASLDRCGIDEPVLVLTATSGDTGSAALAGLGGKPGIRIAVIYPSEGTSEIQRLQITTAPLDSRYVTGLRGTFDDAQRAVKRIFQTAGAADSPFRGIRLSSANSINIGRLLPQIVYYVKAWRDLYFSGAIGREGLFDVVVPSGNFGDILAAKYAKLMGLPIRRLVCASNSNRVLNDFFATGSYDRRRVFSTTLSPSMDILVSSNLERLIYHSLGDDAPRTANLMREFEAAGQLQLPAAARARIDDFDAGWADDAATMASIGHMWREHGALVDPHTAVACKVAHDLQRERARGPAVPVVVAATASPFKFPLPCLSALGASESAAAGASSYSIGGRADGADMDLAANLARLTGVPLPAPIAALKRAEVLHRDIADGSSLIERIAAFARSGL